MWKTETAFDDGCIALNSFVPRRTQIIAAVLVAPIFLVSYSVEGLALKTSGLRFGLLGLSWVILTTRTQSTVTYGAGLPQIAGHRSRLVGRVRFNAQPLRGASLQPRSDGRIQLNLPLKRGGLRFTLSDEDAEQIASTGVVQAESSKARKPIPVTPWPVAIVATFLVVQLLGLMSVMNTASPTKPRLSPWPVDRSTQTPRPPTPSRSQSSIVQEIGVTATSEIQCIDQTVGVTLGATLIKCAPARFRSWVQTRLSTSIPQASAAQIQCATEHFVDVIAAEGRGAVVGSDLWKSAGSCGMDDSAATTVMESWFDLDPGLSS